MMNRLAGISRPTNRPMKTCPDWGRAQERQGRPLQRGALRRERLARPYLRR